MRARTKRPPRRAPAPAPAGQQPAVGGGRAAAQLAQRLRADLHRAAFATGELLPSVRDLARDYTLARGTVNRALRLLAQEGWLAPEARRGYRVLGAPVGADASAGPQTLAYLIHATGTDANAGVDDFYPVLLDGFRQVARERKWPLLVIDAAPGEPPATLARRIAAAGAGGVVSAQVTRELHAALAVHRIPCVRIDSMRYDGVVDTVVQEALPACLAAIDWLHGKGHRRIALFAPPIDPTSLQMQERYFAALGRCDLLGIELQPRATGSLHDADAAYRAAQTLLGAPNRPRAVFAPWQALTFALVRAARDLRLALGHDIDIVGWCAREQFEAQFRPWLRTEDCLPMDLWRIRDLALIAAERLEARRRQPELPVVHLRVPAAFTVDARSVPATV